MEKKRNTDREIINLLAIPVLTGAGAWYFLSSAAFSVGTYLVSFLISLLMTASTAYYLANIFRRIKK